MKQTNKRKAIRYSLVFFIAIVISGITAILPIYISVPRFIYANSVPTFLMTMSLGPISGMAYAAIISLVINNLGMGSGPVIYILMFQILEAAITGIIWSKKGRFILRYIITVCCLTFLIKLFSYLFYYLFNYDSLKDRSIFLYIFEMYKEYLTMGWMDTILLYATGILAAYLIMRGINMITKNENKEKEQ